MKKLKRFFNQNIVFLLLSILLIVSTSVLCVSANNEDNKIKSADLFTGGKFFSEKKGGVALPSNLNGGGNGVFISGIESGADFSYSKPINFTALSPLDDLIAFQTLSGEEYSDTKAVEITLTDTVDSNNKFSIFMWESPWCRNITYNSVGYRNIYRGRYNEDANSPRWGQVRSDYNALPMYAWGSINFNNVMRPMDLPQDLANSSFNISAFRVDYAKRQVIMQDWVILDLDDPAQVGAGREWKGFNNDEAILTVSFFEINRKMGKPAAMVVKTVAGQNFPSENVETANPPNIYKIDIDKDYLNDMPPAVVGKFYPIPVAYAWDPIFGFTTAKTKLIKEGNTDTDLSASIANGGFTPTLEGIYRIEYIAENSLSSSKKTLSFVVNSSPQPLIISMLSYDEPKVFAFFKLPEFTVSGGSGKIATKKVVKFNGSEVTADTFGNIYIDDVGYLQIALSCEDYLGNITHKLFVIEINAVQPILKIGGIPVAVQAGETVTFPDFIAFEYIGGVKTEMSKSIEVNGVALPQNRQYSAPSTGVNSLSVIYKATGTDSVQKTFTLPVIKAVTMSDFFITNATKSVTDNAARFESTSSINAIFFKPIPLRDTAMRFSVANGDGLNYFDIRLKDYNEQTSLFFRLIKKSDGTAVLTVNGEGQEYPVSGSFTNPNNLFSFVFDNDLKILKTTAGNTICSVPQTDKGTVFNGFTDNCALFELYCDISQGNPKIDVLQIANQNFGSYAYINGDSEGPVIITEKRLEMTYHEISINSPFTVYSANAYDVLQTKSYCTARLTDPEGNVILNGASTNQSYTFVGEKYGFYTVAYTAYDAKEFGNESVYTIRYHVIDERTPTLSVSSSPPENLAYGEKITIASATSSTNLYIFFEGPDAKRILVSAGDVVTLSQVGKWRVIYFAQDDFYNTMQITYTIIVK